MKDETRKLIWFVKIILLIPVLLSSCQVSSNGFVKLTQPYPPSMAYISDDDLQLRLPEFVLSLKNALEKQDSRRVAKLIYYPIYIQRLRLTVQSKADFVEWYDKIVTKEILESIKTQSVDSLNKTDNVIWIADNQIRIGWICQGDACMGQPKFLIFEIH
jgi:hypothetical protein